MKVISCPNKGKKCNECVLNNSDLENVSKVIKTGGLVVYPTDTLYGIAADPFNDSAVKKVYLSKNRPFDMSLSVAVSDVRMLESVAVLNDAARKLISKFLPGPLTILLTKKPTISDLLSSGDNLIGIRIPDHPFALRLIKKVGPITATSANHHSKPDPVTAEMAKKDLGSSVDYYVDCGKTRYQTGSTIIDVSEGDVEILRAGVISKEEIINALGRR
ncbi:MAG: L-threonylcarbamoyladenylate synthase [Thermoplasmata archaeon]|nr:L-threonylcarbamoyladenylate synthase [Thermoplasmata archaeon]